MSVDLVRAFLAAMEVRDFGRAQGMLAPGAVMTFPGGRRFTTLEAMAAFAKGRYRFVRKTYSGFDVRDGDGGTTVYCHGVLNGEALDGRPIADVRFIDRFEIRGGQIVDQQVWNDLAEFLPVAQSAADSPDGAQVKA